MFDKNDWRFSRSKKLTEDLLVGAIDIHVHAGPHLFSSPRSTDPLEAARDAKAAGMRAISYMDVFNFTVGTAWMVNLEVADENFSTYGGIILNTVYGGMNPRAVATAVYYGAGARYVTFGAHSTYYQAAKEGRYDENGKWFRLQDQYPDFRDYELAKCIQIPLDKPTRELDQILRIIADNPHIYMESGHVSAQEALRLCDYAKDYGIKKVLISNAVVESMTDKDMETAISKGAMIERLLAEHTHTFCIPKTHYYVEPEYRSLDEGLGESMGAGVSKVAEQIRRFGADNFIIGTDFGVYTLPKPVEGFREFIACLLDCGISVEEVRKVSAANPAKMLGI